MDGLGIWGVLIDSKPAFALKVAVFLNKPRPYLQAFREQ